MNRRDACLLGIQFLAVRSATYAQDLSARSAQAQDLDLINAQTNLGLRPGPDDQLPGTDKAVAALKSAGLDRALSFKSETVIQASPYDRRPQAETRLRNGHSLRGFNQRLAAAVAQSLRSQRFPLVLGGDCSNILGCLLGLRMAGGRGLVHIDGHSDFYHPGNYDVTKRLGSAAGMDLALATGRGEALLTRWDEVVGPLVKDADVIQLGERGRDDPDYPFHEIQNTEIHQITVQEMLDRGIETSARSTIDRLRVRGLKSVWLHIDVDVLDQSVMPAVDSPGAPGLTAAQLRLLVADLLASRRIAGADVAIYDPDLDADRACARTIVDVLSAFGSVPHRAS